MVAPVRTIASDAAAFALRHCSIGLPRCPATTVKYSDAPVGSTCEMWHSPGAAVPPGRPARRPRAWAPGRPQEGRGWGVPPAAGRWSPFEGVVCGAPAGDAALADAFGGRLVDAGLRLVREPDHRRAGAGLH